MKRAVLFTLICGVAVISGSQLYAACAATNPTPIGHYLGGYLDCDDTARVQAFVYQLNAPSTTNTGPLNVACSSPSGPSVTCTGSSPGADGDHHLTIETDATIVGWNGCPAAIRIVAVAIDSVGNGAMLSVSGKDPSFGYFLEAAHQTPDGNSILPITCTATGRPKVVSVSNNGSTVNMSLSVPQSQIETDCDPGSLGKLVTDSGANTVCDGFVATPVRGHLYTSTQACGFADMSLTRWAASTVTPDAAGNASLSTASPTSGNCLYVAASSAITGNPEMLTGYVQVGG